MTKERAMLKYMPQSILSNTVIAMLGRAVNAAFGLVVTALITRYLGPSQFGSYTLLFSYGAIVLLVADFGLYLTLSREIAAGSESEGAEIFSHIISLRLFLLVVAFMIGLVVAVFIPSLTGLASGFVVVAFGLSFQSMSQLCMSVFQKYGEIWRATAGDIVGRLVQVAGILAVGAAAATTRSMIVVFSVSAACSLAAYIFLLPHKVVWRPKFHKETWRRLLRDSWPLGLMLLLNAVYFRIDTVLLSIFRTSQEVGWYGVSYRLIESALFFPAMFGGLLLPRLSAAVAHKKLGQLKQYVEESLQFLLIAAVASVVFLSVGSPLIISIVAGVKFEQAVPLLSLLSWALAIMFIGNLFGFTLIALHRQLDLLKLYAFLVLFNIVLNLLFIPHWGALAASWTTIATEAISSIWAAWLVYRQVAWRISLSFIMRLITLAAATFVLANYVLATDDLWVRVALSSLFYAAGSILFGLLRIKNLKLLTSTPEIFAPNDF